MRGARARAIARRAARGAAVAAAGLALAAALAVGIFEVVVRARPYPLERLDRRPGSWRILDAGGQVLREAVGDGGVRAVWTSIDDMSPLVVEATIAVEDARFYRHAGVDALAVGRAVWQGLRARRTVSGASTITMQLVRLVTPHARSARGKLGEMVDARRLERAVGKRALLEQYLNRAPYGAGTVGIEAASRRYFGKPSSHLSLAEAALLAGLPQAPSALNPLRDLGAARARQRTVLRRLRETGRIDAAEEAAAAAEPLALVAAAPPSLAPHFTDWVLAQRPPPGDVQTTLDLDLQRQVEAVVAEHVRVLAVEGATDAAVVVLDNRSCDVIAMVGSGDAADAADGQVNGALARRQPGSTLKPFAYGLAFDAGIGPNAVLADVPVKYGDPTGALFAPHNYDERFSGPVLAHDALARSLNVPALQVAERVGVADFLAALRLAGFASLDRDPAYYGLGLVLGNGEVTLLELAQGYAMLARGGVGCRARALAASAPSPGVRVLPEKAAFLVTDALSDEAARIAAFGPNNALALGFPVAVKTGTSSNWRDNWAIGYTPRFTVAVWVGDFSGRPMNRMAGAVGAGPLFHRVMERVVRRAGPGAQPAPPEPPAGVVEVAVCSLSGHKAGASCPHTRSLRVAAEDMPTETCDWHRPVAIDRRNGLLAGPGCPAAQVEKRIFAVLPARYASWQSTQTSADVAPTKYSPLCPAGGPASGGLAVTFPRDGEVFLLEPGYDPSTQSIALAAEADPPAAEVTWRVDGKVVARADWPYGASWPLEPGKHTLSATAGGRHSLPVSFEVR